MIFGINTTSDISKLLYVISRAVRQIMLLFVYTTTRKRFVIFTCRYFKLSWNTTALSQSDCSNFSCGSIKHEISALICNFTYEITNCSFIFAWMQWSIMKQKKNGFLNSQAQVHLSAVRFKCRYEIMQRKCDM